MIYLKEGVTPLNFAYNDEIIQEGNSKYQLSFKFPTNNPLWEDLEEETLLLADDLHGEQEFIIFEVEKHHGYITVYANQVATLLNNYSITELSVNNASGDRVMRSLVSSIIREHKFTFSSDIANTHSLNLKNVSVANALFKDKHSILGQWGGDLIRDKYDIRLMSNGGTNKEALFMYKKNLKSYQQKKSIKDLRTRIHFTKTINSQKEGEKDKIIAVTVDSPLIGKYKNIYEGNLDVSDQDVVDEVTLRKYGEQYFKTTLCDVIEESIEINVVGIPDEPVGIFDTVTIFHEKFNLDVKKKITKYTYSPMGRKLKTIAFGKIQSNLGTTLASMVDNAIEEKAETMLDAFKIQKNLSQLLKLDRKGIEDKLVELEEKSKGAIEVKKALFEADGTIPDVVKAKILDAVEGDIGRLKTIITEAELIKAIQAKLNYADIKNALIDKAFINQIISDEKFTQQFEDGEVTTQNIFTKLKDSIKSNISKEFVTKDGVKKLVNDLTIDADGIRQITQQESSKIFEKKKAELKGVDSYIHRKYSDYSNGANMSDNSNLKYIGIYTGTSPTPPTTASSYLWSKIKGEDGANGVPGTKGADGRTPYFHTAYSNSPTGDRDFSTTNSNGKEYIGTYSDFEVADSTDFRKYKWVKIKGENGTKGNDGHSLTANLRFEGTYINNITNHVKAYLDVFYDGQKVDSGFEVKLKDKGGTRADWSDFWNTNVNDGLLLINKNWENGNQNGQPLELIALVIYKGLNTIANARLDNLPDTTEIKEITKKYKTFESAIDQFNSTIGEVKQQVLANEEKRNLVLGSRMISDKDYKPIGNDISRIVNQEYKGLPYMSLVSYVFNRNIWQGVGFNLSKYSISKGERYSIRIPIYINSVGVQLDKGAYVEIKNHLRNEILWNGRLDTANVEKDKWVEREFTFTASKDMFLSDGSFWIYIVRGGIIDIAQPFMCEGDTLPKKYSPAPEDVYLQNSRIESSIKQTKDEIGLKVSKDEVISAINLSVEKNEQGQNQGVVKIKGEVIADNIHGKTFTGSKFEVGRSGFLDSQDNNLRISAPHNWGESSGVGMQLRGRTDGKFNQGLNIYRVNDVRNPETPLYTPDEVALTVFGEIRGTLKVNTAPKSGKLTSVMARAVMSNTSTNTPFRAVGYPGATMWPITGIFLRSGGGPTQIWVNDGSGSNSTYGVNVQNMESDVKLKENISISQHSGIDIINKFTFHSFDWKVDKFGYKKPHTKIGLIAQEVQEIQEDLVYENPNALSLDEFRLLNISLKAIQELSTENQQFKSQLNEMNKRLTKLEDKINGNL